MLTRHSRLTFSLLPNWEGTTSLRFCLQSGMTLATRISLALISPGECIHEHAIERHLESDAYWISRTHPNLQLLWIKSSICRLTLVELTLVELTLVELTLLSSSKKLRQNTKQRNIALNILRRSRLPQRLHHAVPSTAPVKLLREIPKRLHW
jgi:hypothetical protein